MDTPEGARIPGPVRTTPAVREALRAVEADIGIDRPDPEPLAVLGDWRINVVEPISELSGEDRYQVQKYMACDCDHCFEDEHWITTAREYYFSDKLSAEEFVSRKRQYKLEGVDEECSCR